MSFLCRRKIQIFESYFKNVSVIHKSKTNNESIYFKIDYWKMKIPCIIEIELIKIPVIFVASFFVFKWNVMTLY